MLENKFITGCKKIKFKEKEILAQEIRKYILDIVSKMADIWHQTWGL